jgi:hypothetical protein
MMQKYATIKLDKTRHFRYGTNEAIQVEEHFKLPHSKIDFNNLSIKNLCFITWVGLHHYDKTLTVQNVIDLIDQYSSIYDISYQLSEALDQIAESNKENSNEFYLNKPIGRYATSYFDNKNEHSINWFDRKNIQE